ncbi:hypothetical protein FOXB_05166, partial [Fusarium oxysporum f. sp. conglutinans Fo5176]|jgi:hypothetical protein
LIV